MLVPRSCLTLCGPLDRSPPGSSVHGFSRQEYWSGVAIPSSRDLSDPGIKLASLTSPALADQFFTTRLPSPGRDQAVFNLPPPLCWDWEQPSPCVLSRVGSWLPTAVWRASLVFKSAKGACLLGQTPGIECLMCGSNPSL